MFYLDRVGMKVKFWLNLSGVPDLFGGPVVAVVGQDGYMYDAQFRHHPP